jgi:hypothetical protein
LAANCAVGHTCCLIADEPDPWALIIENAKARGKERNSVIAIRRPINWVDHASEFCFTVGGSRFFRDDTDTGSEKHLAGCSVSNEIQLVLRFTKT